MSESKAMNSDITDAELEAIQNQVQEQIDQHGCPTDQELRQEVETRNTSRNRADTVPYASQRTRQPRAFALTLTISVFGSLRAGLNCHALNCHRFTSTASRLTI